MNKLKKIALMAIAIMTTATIVFVACSKEENKIVDSQQESIQKNLNDIYDGYFENTLQILNNIYYLCDSVYQEDSLAILSACNENNLAVFYNLLGLSEIEINNYSDIIGQDITDFMDAYPEYSTSTYTGCSECSASALSNIGNALSATNGHLYVASSEDNKACLAICLLGCLEFPSYLPCVMGCYLLCRIAIS